MTDTPKEKNELEKDWKDLEDEILKQLEEMNETTTNQSTTQKKT